jgi:hypothetical protein
MAKAKDFTTNASKVKSVISDATAETREVLQGISQDINKSVTTPVQEVVSLLAEEIKEQLAPQDGRKPRKTYSEGEQSKYRSNGNTSGRKGVKLSRINMAFTDPNYDYIKTMATVSGQTYTDFVNMVIEAHREAHLDLYMQAINFRKRMK